MNFKFLTYISIFILIISGCWQKKTTTNNYSKFVERQQLLDIDSILIDSTKIMTFNKWMMDKWRNEFKGTALYKNYVFMEKEYHNIGLYSYKPLSTHFRYTYYFLNCIDSINFLDKKDTIEWNRSLMLFEEKYSSNLSDSNLELLKKSYLIDK